jgi:hypothetical protein
VVSGLCAGFVLIAIIKYATPSGTAELNTTPNTLISNSETLKMKSLHKIAEHQVQLDIGRAARPSPDSTRLKRIASSLSEFDESDNSPPTAEEIKLDKELSSAANEYDRSVGTVNFGPNIQNLEPSSWNADDEKQDP